MKRTNGTPAMLTSGAVARVLKISRWKVRRMWLAGLLPSKVTAKGPARVRREMTREQLRRWESG